MSRLERTNFRTLKDFSPALPKTYVVDLIEEYEEEHNATFLRTKKTLVPSYDTRPPRPEIEFVDVWRAFIFEDNKTGEEHRGFSHYVEKRYDEAAKSAYIRSRNI